MKAARSPPRGDPAEEPCLPAEGDTAKGTFGGVVREADAPVIEEPSEGFPAAVLLEHVIYGLGDRVVLRHPGAFVSQPVVQVQYHRRDLPLTGVMAGLGGQAGDHPLDLEDGVEAFDGFQCHGRDLRRDLLALAGLVLDVGQFEELAPGMRPAERAAHGRGLMACMIEVVVTAIGIGLQDACPARQVPGRVFHPSVCREVVECRRWRSAAERPVVAQICPEPGRLRAALRQERHGRVVGMQSFGRKNVSTDQIVDRLERHGHRPRPDRRASRG